MIDAAVKGDKSSPFYSETGENNRLIFPNIETADTDLAQKNLMIDKKDGNLWCRCCITSLPLSNRR